MQLYCGTDFTYEAKGLTPVTQYFFRVQVNHDDFSLSLSSDCYRLVIQAVNSAGPGPYSMLASCVTPAAPPSVVTSVKVHPKSTSIAITWKEPANNGSPISGYYIDIGEKELIFVSPELNEYSVDEVLPDTLYRLDSAAHSDRRRHRTSFSFRIRLRAVNAIGQGPFSSTIKCQTKSLPPDTPRLECIATTCNSLKLRWGSGAIHHAAPASPSTEQATTPPRLLTYVIDVEGKDGT